MSKTIAVIDLGTNTFNLLIARCNRKGLDILYSNKIPVKLGDREINKGSIHHLAYRRGINAVREFHGIIQQFQVAKVKAFGTSAFRTAKNGELFIEEVKAKFNIQIEILSGDQEAQYIYFGVCQTLDKIRGKYLVLDIGGGSNEFIIADSHDMYWRKSYNLGIARLLQKFVPEDPIIEKQIRELEHYFEESLHELVDKAKEFGIDTLVGASGSFETLVSILYKTEGITQIAKTPDSSHIPLDKFYALYEKLICSTLSERMKMKGIEPMRAEMIVIAVLFIKFIVEKLNIKNIIQSNFSLKEGAAFKLLQ